MYSCVLSDSKANGQICLRQQRARTIAATIPYCARSENKLAAARKAESEKTSEKVKQRKTTKSKAPEVEPVEYIDYGEASTPAVGFFKGAVLGYVIATVAVTVAILIMILLEQDVV